jgi:hypothetical protein
MASKVISFRFDDDKLALLKQHQVDGESESQAAMRLLLGVLGVEVKQSSRHAVDIVDSVRNEIKESIADGDIKGAIAHSYQSSINQFNGHLEELQNQIAELKKQVQELQSISPSTAPLISPSADIENLLGIGDILAGSPYDLNYLNEHIGDKLNEHKGQIETALKIKLNLSDPKYICREFNKIIRGLGFTIENKQINKVETYWIVK